MLSLRPVMPLVVALVVGASPVQAEDRVVVLRVAGGVSVHAGGRATPATPGALLRVGASLSTEPGALATLELPAGEVTLFPDTVLRHTAQGFELERGTARVQVRVGDVPVLLSNDLQAFVRGRATLRRVGRGRDLVGLLTTVEEGEVTVDAGGVIAHLVAVSVLDASRDGQTVRLRAAPTNQRAVEVRAAGRAVWLNPGESRALVRGSGQETAERFGAGERLETALLPDGEQLRVVLDTAKARRFVRLPLNAGEHVRLQATHGGPPDSRVVLDLLDASGARIATSPEPAPGKPVEVSFTAPQPVDLVARVEATGPAPGPVTLRIILELGTLLEVPAGYRAVPLDLSGLELNGLTDLAGQLLLATPDGVVRVRGKERPSWVVSIDPGQPPPTAVAQRAIVNGGVEVAYLTEGSGEVRTVQLTQRGGEVVSSQGPSLGTLAAGPGFGPVAIEPDRLPGAYLVAALDDPTAADPAGVGAVYRVRAGAEPVRLLAGLPPLLDLLVHGPRLFLASSGSVRVWGASLDGAGQPGTPRLLATLEGTVDRARLGLLAGDLILTTPSRQAVFWIRPGEKPTDPWRLEEFGKTTWFPQAISDADGLAFVALSSGPDGQGLVVHVVGREEDMRRLLDGGELPRFDREQNEKRLAIGAPGEPPPPAPTGDVTGGTPTQLQPVVPPSAPPPAPATPPPAAPPPTPPPGVPPVPPAVSGA